MGDIYETAAITIVAASAHNCNQSFLQRRSYPWGVQGWKAFKLPIRCPDGKRGELICDPEDSYFSGEQPINHRAWTLQEFLLPPRKLVYSTTQLIWQCRSVQTELGGLVKKFEYIKESFRNGFILTQIMPAVLSKDTASVFPASDPTAKGVYDAWSNWENLVEDYSGRALTNREDTLPGISGIASKFFNYLNEEYTAGLWYRESNPSNFVNELLWNVRQHNFSISHKQTSSESYIAPSWSWAGQPRRVEFISSIFKKKMVCSIVERSVQLATVAPFGQVKSGSLKIQAMTAKVDRRRNDDKAHSLRDNIDFLDRDDIDILLDDAVENLEARLGTGPLWCLLLTVNEGLLVMPLDEKNWLRIGIFCGRGGIGKVRDGRMERSESLSEWFQDREFEEVTIV